MKKHLRYILLFCITASSAMAQQTETFAEVPPLYIENKTDSPKSPEQDFGYNIHVSAPKKLNSNYYLWVDDHWYEVVNAKEVFIKDADTPLLFTIKDIDNRILKIKDSLDVVYTYPIRAISPNFIDQKTYQSIDRTKLMKKANELIESYLPKEVLTDAELPQDTIVSVPEIITDTVAKSPILDIIDIKETTVTTTKPFDPEATEITDSLPIEVLSAEELNIKEISSEIQPDTTPERPKNAYEQAIADGFEGTVTEWVEWSIKEKKINPYEEAVKNGFEGTEDEWKRTLWGSSVSPEIRARENTTSIVVKWMDELSSSDGFSPYERALRNGFYGSFTEWVESVIGTEGEKAYDKAKEEGYTGTYKEWIEEKLNASNDEIMRKDRLRNTNFVLVPNVQIDMPQYTEEVAVFDLFDYYQKYYGNSVISSSGQNSGLNIKPNDLEYQVTWYDNNMIKITELTPDGIIKYQCLAEGERTSINVRFVLKN